jgi:hypothetical protein
MGCDVLSGRKVKSGLLRAPSASAPNYRVFNKSRNPWEKARGARVSWRENFAGNVASQIARSQSP